MGQLLAAIKTAGIDDNTLVIFTSDNGCAHYIGAAELEAQGHYPSGCFRGYKSDAWDGGRILDTASGKIYRCKLWRKGATLQVRGYIGFSLFGRSQTWRRR